MNHFRLLRRGALLALTAVFSGAAAAAAARNKNRTANPKKLRVFIFPSRLPPFSGCYRSAISRTASTVSTRRPSPEL